MKKRNLSALLLAGILMFTLSGCEDPNALRFVPTTYEGSLETSESKEPASLTYSGEPATQINDNIPYFTEDEIANVKNNPSGFVTFSDLDELNRTKMAYAVLDQSMMPGYDIERKDISSIKPTGWIQAQYEDIDNGGWLYNRCHLIAWSLTGENDNEKNLITGTRYLNTEGMLPYEIQVLRYLNAYPENHVMYRVTPQYSGSDLLAKGLLLEAYSVEDNGTLAFCTYVYNIQPNIIIDYSTGESHIKE